MSVINSVLKNLEHKSSSFIPLDIGELTANKQAPKKKSRQWLLLPFFIVLGMGLMAYYWGPYLNLQVRPQGNAETGQKEVPLLNKSEVESLTSDEVIGEINPAPVIPAKEVITPPLFEIIGLQINENRDNMELEFQLSGKVNIFLKQRVNQLYVFQFENTKSAILVPELVDNPWVSKVSIKQDQNRLNLLFNTREGVLIETRDSQQANKNRWTILFKLPGQKILNVPDVKSVPTTVNKPPETASEAITEQKSETAETQAKEVRLNIKPVQQKVSDDQRFRNAQVLLNRGQWIVAETELLKLLGGDQDRLARMKLLEIYQGKKDSDQTSRLLQESLEVYPQDIDLLKLQANQWFTSGKYLNVINQFEDNLTDIQLIKLVATSQQRLGQHERAIDTFNTALKLDPLQSKLWVSLAISQQHLDLHSQALNSYQMALKSGQLNDRLNSFVNQKIQQLLR